MGGLAALPLLGHARPAAAGTLSRLPWNSGCSLADVDKWAAFRGRDIDTSTTWGASDTWDDVARLDGGFPILARRPARISVVIVPLPKSADIRTNPGNYRRAANGDFDRYYIAWAKNLAASGRSRSIVRIGWECNGRRAWTYLTDPVGFKATFRRIAGIVRKYNPGVAIEWSNQRRAVDGSNVLNAYPGSDVVDIIGVNYYDSWPGLNTEAIWNTTHNTWNKNGGPWGLGTWLVTAKKLGRPIGISEWGIWRGGGPGSTDNPLFIRKMYEFFQANAAWIAYENYFNQIDGHRINPANINPKASAEYRRLWA